MACLALLLSLVPTSLVLVGCKQGNDASTVMENVADGAMAPPSQPSDIAPPARPDPLAPVLTREADGGETGARSLLLRFARAIELGRYGEARDMLGGADRQRWSPGAFARMFADLPDCSIAVPEGTMEGAAGSLYYTAPVVVTGHDRDGRPVRIEGEAVLRRVNDVDGASAEQRRWHFERLTLDWTH